MSNFLHCLGFMVLMDNGFVEVPHIQLWPYLIHWLHWISHWRYPWCWFDLWLQNVLFYHVVNGLFDDCLALNWHLLPCMLYWWHCWINFNAISSLERSKSIKWIGIELKKVLNTADLDWARFVVYGVRLWPRKFLGCRGYYNVLWVFVTLEVVLELM